jgi:two-component sensor histidine kinase
VEGGREKERMEWLHKSLDRFVSDRNPALYTLLTEQVTQMSSAGQSAEALDLVMDLAKKIPPVSFSDFFAYHLALTTCYNGLRQFELAKMHLSKADSMETRAESFRGPLRRSVINMEYGYLYLLMFQYRDARSYFEKYFLSTPSASRTLTNDLTAYRNLIYLDSVLHDPASGLVHYKKYTQVLDSNLTVSRLRQAEELQVMYKTEEKENQITLLNQEAKLEQSDLKQATLIKNMTIAGIVAVLIIAGLLYRQNRLKQKNNDVITLKNEQLQHFLTEKGWLLKEIHHRVKNNLQTVMSLLNSQSAYIENESALTAIHDSQHRVHAMSLIHQKLYNSENVSTIDMSFYIRELVAYLCESFNTGQRIRFEIAIQPFEMDVSQAVPLGLILNEAITNAIKYAFPDGRNGIISISLSHADSGHCLLIISDNGIGIPFQFNNKKPGSLGMTLMEGLSEDLAGSFSIENTKGTTVRISFEFEPEVKRSDALAVSFASKN